MVFRSKKLQALIWKCLVLRKRSLILTTFELLSPILVIYFAYVIIIDVVHDVPEDVGLIGISPRRIPQVPSHVVLAYTPMNNFTDQIMEGLLSDSLGPFVSKPIRAVLNQKPLVIGKKSGEDLEIWLKYNKWDPAYMAIVFLSTNPRTKTFKYTIRTNPRSDFSKFLSIQFRVDIELLKSIGLKSYDGEFEPLVELKKDRTISFVVLYLFMMLAYVFLVASVVTDAIQEKASGIKELMRVMDVSYWMIWIHWLMYKLIVQVPVTICITFILSGLSPTIIKGSVFVVWVLLFLYTVNCIIMLFLLSCLFNGPNMGATICVCGWFIVHIVSINYFSPIQYGFFTQIIFCLVPLNNLLWSFHSLSSFNDVGVNWNLHYLFLEGYTGSRISVGLSMVIFILEILAFRIGIVLLDKNQPHSHGLTKKVMLFLQRWKNLCCASSQAELHDSPRVKTPIQRMFQCPPKGSKVLFEMKGLQKTYGWHDEVVAVKNVDMKIYEGEILALVGHNGAGKTTILSMITGISSPTQGIILFDGKDLSGDLTDYRKNLGICTQDNLYLPKLTVFEHLIFFGMLKGMSYCQAKTNGMDLMKLLNISHKKYKTVSSLSAGEKRRLCISISLIGNPKILILDEPTAGLDSETRRNIWNIILGMRGQCTILITTNVMEEADVLGDRIALMDHGQVLCSGTTEFLRKRFGTGYHVKIMKEPNSSVEDISYLVRKSVVNPRIKIVSPSQLDIFIKEDSINKFPELFEALEDYRSRLKINGMSIRCTTLEDVLLKVADQSIDFTSSEVEFLSSATHRVRTCSIAEYNKDESLYLCCQRLVTLVFKRIIYHWRNLQCLVIKILITSFMIFTMSYSTQIEEDENIKVGPSEINLEIYPEFIIPVVYDEDSKEIAHIAMNLISKMKGEVTILPRNTNISHYLIELAAKDFFRYSKALLTLRFTNGSLKMHYRNENYLPAIAANLMANIMLQNITNDSNASIQVIDHLFSFPEEWRCFVKSIFQHLTPINWLFFFFFTLITLMTYFIRFILEERVSGFKHQQILAGVSPLLYWFANFICDYFLYICIIALYLGIIVHFVRVIIQNSLLGSLTLVLALYGFSGLLFNYLYTYLIDSNYLSISVFMMGNIVFSLIPVFVISNNRIITNFRAFLFVTSLLSLNPLFATLMSVHTIASAFVNIYLCEYCDESVCTVSEASLLIMPTEEDRRGILIYVLFLAFSPILYLGIILLMDCGFIGRINNLFLRLVQRIPKNKLSEDDDVNTEIEKVRVMNKSGNTKMPLRVECLIKKYFPGPLAVDNVSFVVAPGECFGLLGSSGAGKSTIFKILTGQLIPNSGNAVILNHSQMSNRGKYQACLGYCPQFDSFLYKLTGNETLKIIAQLRGVPQREVKMEVTNWLKMMDLKEYANNRNGTYSKENKRKLSTAMAFIGEPVIVFLDEPTTGVDSTSKRKLSNLVHIQQSTGQAILLTSHSMEECEALCTRLTILKKGQMICIGTAEYLKNKFDQGYTVFVKLARPTIDQLNSFKVQFNEVFPEALIKDEHSSMIHYQIQDLGRTIPLSQLFTEMLRLKMEHRIIEDFTVSCTTMEQVFQSLA